MTDRELTVALDHVADALDDMAALGLHWTRNRERGRMPSGIRAAMLACVEGDDDDEAPAASTLLDRLRAAEADYTIAYGNGDLYGEAADAFEACEPFLKDGETPAQRIERERRDTEAVLNLLVREKERTETLRRALHDIAEEWAGAECGEPVHAQEAYAIGLAKRMYALAAAALAPNVEFSGGPLDSRATWVAVGRPLQRRVRHHP